MNYFNYFSEVEERFVARRGSALLLSTLDWALIETWREAGVPLPAVLRGIDTAFDRYDARKARAAGSRGRLGKVNGLAWCAQAVMDAATEMAEAAVGARAPVRSEAASGFEAARVAAYLAGNAAVLSSLAARESLPALGTAYGETALRLEALGEGIRAAAAPALDELDRTLTVLEERLQAAVVSSVPETEMLAVREAADRELAPVRSRLGAVQLRQVRDQFLHKQLFAARGLPRLSLFYMPLGDPDPQG